MCCKRNSYKILVRLETDPFTLEINMKNSQTKQNKTKFPI